MTVPKPPSPLPAWFWKLAAWRLGHGPYKGHAFDLRLRPKGIPSRLPAWFEPEFRRRFRRPSSVPATTTVHPSPMWFEGDCTYINIARNAPANELLLAMGDEYRTVIVVLMRGIVADHDEGYVPGWVRQLQQAGKHVVGAQWGTAVDPDAEARAGWEMARSLGLNGWMMNGEKPYEFAGLSARYVRRFRSLSGQAFPLGWTPEPYLALDHHVFRENGVVYCPQAYPNENWWDIDECLKTATYTLGYQARDVIPLAGVHARNGERYPATAFAAEAKRSGVRSLCLYPGDEVVLQPGIWRALASR